MRQGRAAETKTQRLPLETVLSAISSSTRWAILRLLAKGEQMAVVEIAEQLDLTPTAVSKHMAVLLNAGIVSLGRNRLYSVPSDFIVAGEQPILDLGWCLLRL